MTLSVVIPYYNNENLLMENIDSLFKALKKASYSYEIIIVDDYSNVGDVNSITREYSEYPIKIIKNIHNVGFSKTANKGIKAAVGELVFLLNTDIKLDEECLVGIADEFKDDNLFGVGLRQIILEGNKKIDNKPCKAKFSYGMLRRTYYVGGGAGIFDRRKLVELGIFDTIFSPFYYEDADLSYRALKKGWRIVLDRDRKVEHRHETTINRSYPKLFIKCVAQRNWVLFNWKNLDSKNLIKHLLWLPINIVRELAVGNFSFILGLCWATIYLPRVLTTRSRQTFIRTDKQILNES